MVNGEKLKVTILLERHPGERWFAKAPAAPTCVAEGQDPEEATANFLIELAFQIKTPETLKKLTASPEYLLTQVEVSLPPTNA